MAVLRLAVASVVNRRATAALTIIAIALSVALLLGVEKVRRDARLSFTNTLSGTDLIVGARSGAVQLLLYSVFRVGNATNNIRWESYQAVAAMPNVRWTIPMALGDSHRGYRVLGTNHAYFEHYKYARTRQLAFASGKRLDDLYDAVLGAEVAAQLGYRQGDAIVIAHGAGEVSFIDHSDKPFTVVGVLERTGTPVDRTIHVNLEAIEAIHLGWESGAPTPAGRVSAEAARQRDLTPKAITAVLVGLDSKLAIFKRLRAINEYRPEPLLAIIPGVALQELWDLLGVAESALRGVSVMVVITGLLGMLTVILSSLEARRREMAVLRAVGARPGHIFALFVSEALVLAAAGTALGTALLYALIALIRPWVTAQFGLHIPMTWLTATDGLLLAGVLAAATIAGLLPAWRAYRLSLSDGLTIRL